MASPFTHRQPTVLIVGQVLNDFSIIETDLPELSATAVYRRLIDRLLAETNCNVIFKAHPWERHRPNLGMPITLRDLEAYANSLPEARRRRLWLVEDLPIRQLFYHADWAVALNSQGLLEACQAGLKPAQIGQAFFGGQGFTHDLPNADAFVDGLAAGCISPLLSLDEYRSFEDFLVKALIIDLVTNEPSGQDSVLARLREPSHVPVTPPIDALDLVRNRPALLDFIREMTSNPMPWMHDAIDWLARTWSDRSMAPKSIPESHQQENS